MGSQSVALVQRRLTNYRVPLFELMRDLLAKENIRLRLLHGEPDKAEQSKRDAGTIPWAEHVPARYFAGGKVCWQPFGARTRECDLVVMTQENKLLYNLLALTLCRPRRVAFWGHGRNFQSSAANGVRERFKRLTTKKADWWFAYTEGTRRLVAQSGFPLDRITTLNNAVDTNRLRRELDQVSDDEVVAMRRRLGLQAGRTAIYLGSLYHEKRLPFLLSAGEQLAREIDGFRLIVVGDGPDRQLVARMGETAPWLDYLGPKQGMERAVLLRTADVCMNPGLVGLGIVDMFTAGIPMLTTDCPVHSPEIEYLVPGENGLMADDSLSAYVETVRALIRDPQRLRKLSRGAHDTGRQYTIENMARNFATGIHACLSATRQ